MLNRRTTLRTLWTSLMAGLGMGSLSTPRTARSMGPEPAIQTSRAEADDPRIAFEPGHTLQTIDISAYTKLDPAGSDAGRPPQQAIIDWIRRQNIKSPEDPWFGSSLTCLSADRNRLRIYHKLEVIGRVERLVERFIRAQHNWINLNILILSVDDPSWRELFLNDLRRRATGPQGQQIWTTDLRTAALIFAEISRRDGFTPLYNKKNLHVLNGQPFSITLASTPRPFISGFQRSARPGIGYDDITDQIREEIGLTINSLLKFEADAVDAEVEFRANSVLGMVNAQVNVPFRGSEFQQRTIQIPRVIETRIKQPIASWKLGQSLIITGGVHPGIFQATKANSLLGNLGGYRATELIAIIDAEASDGPNGGKTAIP